MQPEEKLRIQPVFDHIQPKLSSLADSARTHGSGAGRASGGPRHRSRAKGRVLAATFCRRLGEAQSVPP